MAAASISTGREALVRLKSHAGDQDRSRAIGAWGRGEAAQTWGEFMTLSAPTMQVFIVSVALAVLALIGHFVSIPFVTLYQFWVALAAYVVLLIGCLMKGA
jgi:hypothetical protein